MTGNFKDRIPKTDVGINAPEVNRCRLEKTHEVVRTNLARAFQKQTKYYYDLRRRVWKTRIGETMWKHTHTLSSKKDAVNAKLTSKYIEPHDPQDHFTR